MLNLLIGGAIFAVSAFVFWSAMPVDGKIRPWITPRIEPYVVVGLLAGAVIGVFLIVIGAIAILR
jgi:hypothetical protein